MRFRRRRAAALAAVVVLILGGLFAFWTVDNYATGASQGSPIIGLDVDPSGNTGTSTGTIDVCSPAAVGTTFNVDVVVHEIRDVEAYQLDLLYSPSVVKVTAVEPGPLVQPGGVDFSDSVPDGDGHLLLAYLSLQGPSHAESGALARVTFEAVDSGLARLRLANVSLARWGPSGPEIIGDSDGDIFFDGPLPDAFIAVDEPCPSTEALASGAVQAAALPTPPSRVPQGEPPTPEPSPTPPAIAEATPAAYHEPKLVQSASPEIVYPPEVADLPDNIWALAADPATGDLWFPVLASPESLTPRIYRYSPADGKLDFWELPVEPYTTSVLDMALDDQGNVWLAWGYNIVRFGTSTLSATAYPLAKDIQYPRAGASDVGSPVTALAVDSTGKVWFTRYNGAAILELDPTSGAVREHAVPAYFATPFVARMEIDAQGRLWLPGGVPSGSDRIDRLGEFDTATGSLTLHDVPAFSLAVGKQGEVWVPVSGEAAGALQKLDSKSGKASLVTDLPLVAPADDLLVVDPSTGDVWVSSFSESKIGRYSASSGEAQWFSLPIVEHDTSKFPGPIPIDRAAHLPPTMKIRTHVNAMAVDIAGNLWFAHGRTIGMIPAP